MKKNYKDNIIMNDKGEYGIKCYSESYRKFASEFLTAILFIYKTQTIEDNVESKKFALTQLKSAFDPKDVMGKILNEAFSKLDESIFNMEVYERHLAQMILCRMVDNFLSYLKDILTEVVVIRPEILKSKDASEKLDFILSHDSLEDLVNSIVERKIEELSYKSLEDIVHFFESRLGIKPFFEGDVYPIMVKIKERNILVHNRGIINQRFAKDLNLKKELIGKQISFDLQNVLLAHIAFYNEVVFIDSKISSKFAITTHSQNV